VLFEPLMQRGVTARNRVMVSPMCQYSCNARDGLATPWHLVHLGQRAVGGAGIVSTEATAISPEGRISPQDLGIWSEAHRDALAPIVAFIKEQGAVPMIQLGHAGRKASTGRPWEGGGFVEPRDGGWEPLAPSAIPFDPTWPPPRAMTSADIEKVVADFANATRLADAAGFEMLELHAAHGYLIHEFLTPLANRRTDEYGGSFENRTRLALRVARAVRQAWPERKPLWVRLSCTDWVEGGWDLEQSVELARLLHKEGVDTIDCSSGGADLRQKIPLAPGYQVPFSARIRREAKIATAAVGLIEAPEQAEAILVNGEADVIVMARAHLRDPYWTLHAAQTLGVDVPWPPQYLRAKPAVTEKVGVR
jgi:2,4-dienoyl-CoA reductase-like NADH-dependent reductase (Old Yellow Enzyme family)